MSKTYLSEDASLKNVKARIVAGLVKILFDTAEKPHGNWVEDELYITHDYPMGRRKDTRSTMKWGIERKGRFGVRVLRTSKNRSGRWNKTKTETYNQRLIFLADEEEDRMYFLSQGNLGGWALYGGNLYMLKSYYLSGKPVDDDLFALPANPEPEPRPEPEPTAADKLMAAGQMALL